MKVCRVSMMKLGEFVVVCSRRRRNGQRGTPELGGRVQIT